MAAAFLLLRTEAGSYERIAVDGAGFTMGRSPECSLCIADPSVSRHHARILRDVDGLVLSDLHSRSGTVLNGARVRESVRLSNGDWIRIGDVLLLVCDHAPARSDELRLDGLARVREPERSVAPEDAVDASRILYTLPSVSRPMAETASGPRLALLEQVSRTLQSVTALEEILTVLLGVAFDLVDPERGAILLRNRADDSMQVVTSHPDEDADFVSHTLVSHATRQRATLVVRDVMDDPRFRGVPSLHEKETRAAICCPLVSRDELVGVLYLDARMGELGARREEIGLLNLIACFAAAAIENAVLLRDRSHRRELADLDAEPLVTRSEAMTRAREELLAHATGSAPLLIGGDRGTGKLLAARHVHLAGRGAEAPFLALDCAQMPARDLRNVLFGPPGAGDALAPPGAWRETTGGTLVLEHVDALDLLAQTALVDLLAVSAAPTDGPRLIATTTEDLDRLVAESRFHADLKGAFGANTVRLPRLRDRSEDVAPLARHFLAAFARKHSVPVKQIGPTAQRTLEAAKFRESNVHELREAVELAATLSDGPRIEAEHVFTGPRVRDHRWELDLGRNPIVQKLLRRPVHAAVGVAVVGLFLSIAGSCLLWPDRILGRAANGVVWGLWWPGLLVSFVAVGRVWCSVCPVSRIARWGQALRTLGRRPGTWIKEHGRWIMAGLFALIVWSEHTFSMPEQPFATGVLLLSLVAVAMLAAVGTQREVWCRYACPLGNLSACYSVPATVHVHANPAICQSQCKTHECFKGSELESGCPMYLHPLYVKDAHFCKLCMSCVRNCPNGSARLLVRPPLQDVWSLGELNPALTPLALTVFLVSPLALASSTTPTFSGTVVYSGVMVLLLALVRPLEWSLTRWMTARDEVATARVAAALAILAWGPLMAFHLGHVPGLAELTVRAASAGLWAALWPAAGIPVLSALQTTTILATALAAGVVLGSLRARAALRPAAFMILVGAAAIYVVASIWMVV
jgi:transcriptional regulator with GAF, ATPase, and Fis domain